MNLKRMLMAGLAAGVVLNIGEGVLWGVVLADRNAAMMTSLGLAEQSWAMAGYVMTVLAIGVILAWLYAAIRPRYGAGFQTAGRAGLALWITAWIIPGIWTAAIGIDMGLGVWLLAAGWGFVEVMLAGYVAGSIYQEATAGAPAAAPAAAGHPM